jgi:hypothetical protein
MTFQLWVRALLCDATWENKAHVVARINPHRIRSLYAQGVKPTIKEILKHTEAKDTKAA